MVILTFSLQIWATTGINHVCLVFSGTKTVPKEFCGMSRNDIVRRVGGTIWARSSVLREEYYDSVKITVSEHNGEICTRFETPVGVVETLEVPT